MQFEQQPKTPETQRSSETFEHSAPGVEPHINVRRGVTGTWAWLFGAGVVLGALLLGILMVKVFPEFAVSKIIYAMVGR